MSTKLTSEQTRITKDPETGWKIEVRLNGHWYLKRWTAGTKADARKAEAEVRKELERVNQTNTRDFS